MAAVDSQKLIQALANRITKETLEAASSSMVGSDQSIAYEAGRRYGYTRGMEFAMKFIVHEFSRKDDEDQDL